MYNFTTEDLVHLEENFSGTRLMEELRKKLPGIIPSQRQERAFKKILDAQFKTILLPKRTKTGWSVDPQRLTEILSFKYFWLEKNVHWKVYGDGREIGKRHSCFLSLNILNNEAKLHNISYQSPKDIFPFFVFYES